MTTEQKSRHPVHHRVERATHVRLQGGRRLRHRDGNLTLDRQGI